ncbi:MAG: hypothetical protein IJI24_02390 [Lachnospiraceae bacterium]|nr:hypothetical protein [Lachnospiraceae bacterium]
MSEGSHRFQSRTVPLKNLLPLIRMSGYDNRDEGGKTIRLCPECEEWTHVRFNENSGFLDLLGDLLVESLDADDDEIVLWIKTDDYNWFNIGD